VTDDRRITLADAAIRASAAPDAFATVLSQGSLQVGLYAPSGVDPQTPHTRDELYVVMRGAGWFVNGDVREPFGPGDILHVPAGVEHRFEEFTDDFATWVVFYGPEGGEGTS
jgi:mannose-6-phosphate isomerase-like protein (cupin superfamily)